jgi:hypothetical protein
MTVTQTSVHTDNTLEYKYKILDALGINKKIYERFCLKRNCDRNNPEIFLNFLSSHTFDY